MLAGPDLGRRQACEEEGHVLGDEIDSIPGLEEKHRRALASKLGITSLQALADGDQRAIYNALASFRPRPTPELVEAWQDDARRRLSDAAKASAWHTAASFAVIFAQRQVDGRLERQLEAEQTEVEPAPEPRQWATWDCGPLCDWMLGQLGLPEDGSAAVAAGRGRCRARGHGALRPDEPSCVSTTSRSPRQAATWS